MTVHAAAPVENGGTLTVAPAASGGVIAPMPPRSTATSPAKNAACARRLAVATMVQPFVRELARTVDSRQTEQNGNTGQIPNFVNSYQNTLDRISKRRGCACAASARSRPGAARSGILPRAAKRQPINMKRRPPGRDEVMENRIVGTTMPVLEVTLQPGESVVAEGGEAARG